MKKHPPPPDFLKYLNSPLPVDLSTKDGAERWRKVIEVDRAASEQLFKNALKQFPLIARLTSGAFGTLFKGFHAPYVGEIEAWAKATRNSFGDAAMVNCAYEYDHLGEALNSWSAFFKIVWRSIFGCTSAVVKLSGGETVHIRNLDWPIPGMGPSTRIFDFSGGPHPFKVVSFPGFVGALSGIVPGAYSVTINWAPPEQFPSFKNYAPAFLLRETLEHCGTYAEACKTLKEERLSASVFYTVCGINEGCVIERTTREFDTRPLQNGFVAQTNHHVGSKFKSNNELLNEIGPDYLVETTFQRLLDMESSIKASGINNAPWSGFPLLQTLNRGDVTNYQTTQRMVLRPLTGEICLEVAKETA